MQKPIRTIVSASIAAMIATSAAHAGSFSLYTESRAAAIGNYAAGIAAEAGDASIGWYNPAGLVLIKNQQVVFGGVGVFPSSEVTGTSTFRTFSTANPSANLGLTPYVQSFNGLDGAKNGFVPSFHYARPLTDRVTFGLSMVSPFGLATKWSESGPLRYAATESKLLTTTFSPELGGKLTDNFSIGAGLDLQYAKVAFNSVIGAPVFTQFLGLPANYLDSTSVNKGDSFGVGFHAGAMLMLNDNHTRIGVNYQSEVEHHFHGTSQLSGRLATPGGIIPGNTGSVFWSNELSSNDIDLPQIVTLSGYHDVNDRLALLASVVFTGWESLKTIELDKVAAYASAVGHPVLVNSTSTQYYNNAWRAALGANYKLNQQWMVRVGGGYDETPTNDANRDIRIADTDRWALSAGAHYQPTPALGFDFGYTHLFSAEDVKINKTQVLDTNPLGTTSTYNVNAKATGSADLIGLQFVWNMDGVPEPVMTK